MSAFKTDILRNSDVLTEEENELQGHGRLDPLVLSPSNRIPNPDHGGGGHGPPVPGNPPPSDAIVHYLGPNFDTQAEVSGFYVIPPDNTSAAGDEAVVIAVNSETQIWTRSATDPNQLTMSFETSLSDLFGAGEDFPFDPRVLYDPNSDRFILVSVDLDTEAETTHINVAVSNTASPDSADDFSVLRLDVGGAIPGSWADFPQAGLDNAGNIYITANMFSFEGDFTGTRLWIVDEDSLTASAAIDPNGAAEDLFSLTPTNMPTGSGNFLLAYNSATNAAGHNVVDVIRVTADTGQGVQQQVDVGAIDLAPQFASIGAPQAGTQRDIDAGDTRMHYAVWRDGHLYAVSNIVPDEGPDAGHVTAHFWAFNASTGGGAVTLANQGDMSGNTYIEGSDLRSYYPSVAVGEDDQLAVGFSGSAPSNGEDYVGYGSAYVAIFDPLADTSGTGYQEIGDWQVHHAGVAPYFRAFGPQLDNRWGDYSSITVDPLDPDHYWAFNQYADEPGTVLRGLGAESGRWATDLGLFA